MGGFVTQPLHVATSVREGDCRLTGTHMTQDCGDTGYSDLHDICMICTTRPLKKLFLVGFRPLYFVDIEIARFFL